MIIKASEKWNIDLKKSFFVGDRWKDMQAGKIMGCNNIFIDYAYNETQPKSYNYKFKTIGLMIKKIKKIL